MRRSIVSDVQFEVLDGSPDKMLQLESVKRDAVIIGAHKFILALGSPVFKMQFYGHFKEKDDQRVIRIVDSSPEVFRVFIKCFYEEVDISQLNIKFLCDLYYLGDKYNIEDLKVKLCLRQYGTPILTISFPGRHNNDSCL